MKRLTLLVIVAVATVSCLSAIAARTPADAGGKVSITLPPANIDLKPGPNLGLAQAKCVVCHSADYIYTQPPLNKKQWTAEVQKMQKTFGGPISDDDVAPLVDYLMSQNGKP